MPREEYLFIQMENFLVSPTAPPTDGLTIANNFIQLKHTSPARVRRTYCSYNCDSKEHRVNKVPMIRLEFLHCGGVV
jgi:hypothetical protein